MDLETVADELYGLRPEEFTAARDERAAAARKAGDRPLAERIKALRRPSLAAWAGNLLVRGQPDEVRPLIQLGEGLRRAHRGMDGPRLRELSRQQHVLINALSRQAGRLAADAGHPIGEDTRREVEQTLHAVLADERAARAWAQGRLTRPLDATTGFDAALRGAGPHEEAAEPPPEKRRPRPKAWKRDAAADARRREELARARRDADEADRALRERRKEAAAADERAAAAADRVREAERRLAELEEERRSAAERHERARSAEREAREAARAAARAARAAGSRAEQASALLDRLDTEDPDHRDGEGDDD
ncbi:hypothetical protein AB0I16_32355 [Streptomyces sp. NPDC050703]|uniref:hypothetical protein n=1 Tax=Streptomyces sp. NPDC050703 TaxID=3157218 RepID=UPI00341E3551